ncbi:MAG TPA: hypothetical protein VK638_35190 [Edaphobacter sp.]|nr:hypothetical protein [Edaphobacter sp.]
MSANRAWLQRSLQLTDVYHISTSSVLVTVGPSVNLFAKVVNGGAEWEESAEAATTPWNRVLFLRPWTRRWHRVA